MFRNIVFVILFGVSTLAVWSASAQMEESVRGGNRDRAPVINVRDFNLQKYEGRHGQIQEAPAPKPDQFQN
jgi:hypothetical protein